MKTSSLLPTFLLLGASAPFALGQSVFAPEDAGSTVGQVEAPAGPATEPDAPLLVGTPLPAPLQLEWADIRPHFEDRFSYGNGIQALPGQSSTTALNSFSPGILANLGTHWILDYTPTWNVYSNSAFHNDVDESASLNFATTYEAWTFDASQRYTREDQPRAETGGQTLETDDYTTVEATYQFATQIALQTTIAQSLRFTSGFTNSRDWSILEYVHYAIASDLDVAGGLKLGYSQITPGADMEYTQFLGRVAARPTKELTLALQAGVEARRAEDPQGTKSANPVFNGSVQYRPSDASVFSFNIDRSASASYFVDEFVEITRVSAGLDQRLFQDFFLNIEAGYQNTKYRGEIRGLNAARKDDNDFVDVRLDFHVLRRTTMGVFYIHNRNSSNQGAYTYSSNQVGFQVDYRF